MKKQKGFTLVELLVVIAIIGLLSTLAFVSLNSARSKARDAKRVSDVRQIQSALELYYNNQAAPAYPIQTTRTNIGTGVTTIGSASLGTTLPTASSQSDCADTNWGATDGYYYKSDATGSTYTIEYCLGTVTGGIATGIHTATPVGLGG